MEKRKELLNQLAQDIKKIKEEYKCLNLSNEEFNQITTKIIDKTDYVNNDELFILSIKDKLIKELNKKIKNQEPEEKKILVNDFINNNFKESNNYIESQDEINKILEFLKKTNYDLNPETIIELLENNRVIKNYIKVITEKNISLIRANGIEKVFTNNNLIYFVEIYCDINNIELNRKYEDTEMADENIEIVKMYFKDIKNIPVLTKEQETELAARIEQGDEKAKEIFIKSNLRLVVSVAKNYISKSTEFADLIQDGNLGLIKAVEKFDYRKGYKFSSYATWWIRQTIVREHQNKGRTIRLPVNVLEKMDKIKKIIIEFEDKFNRKPTIEEITKNTGITIERLNEIYSYQKENVSLNTMIGDKEDIEISEIISNEETPVEEIVDRKTLPKEVNQLIEEANLTEREKLIIMLRYGYVKKPMSLSEVGEMLEITRERVRQIEARAIIKLRSSKKIKDLIIYTSNQKQTKSNLDKYLKLIEIGPKNKIYADDNLDDAIEKYSKLYRSGRKRRR